MSRNWFTRTENQLEHGRWRAFELWGIGGEIFRTPKDFEKVAYSFLTA
jgi:hypothetical protein